HSRQLRGRGRAAAGSTGPHEQEEKRQQRRARPGHASNVRIYGGARYSAVMRVLRASFVLAALSVALALPIAVFAGGSAQRAAPTFAFGRTGGNIVPFTVTIAGNGHVGATGPVHVSATQASTPLRNGLGKLA